MKKKKVIVVGGGYGGLRAVERLAADGRFDITLIDAHPYHYLQTEAYGYIAGRFDIHDITIDLANWCGGFGPAVTFVHAKVTGVDEVRQTVRAEERDLPYDYLIVAVGARTRFFPFVKGLREYSFGVKNLPRAFAFRRRFERLICDKVRERRDTAGSELHIAVGGAGLSGVEIAAEMADVIAKHHRTLGTNARKIRIRLIDAAETILPGMHPALVARTVRRLERLGIEILTNAFIDSVEEDRILLKDGTALPYHFMIFTGGIEAGRFASPLSAPVNRIGQLIPDPFLNVGNPRIFAVGDCVELRDLRGEPLPPTAQTAEKSAEYVVKSIRTIEDGRRVKPFRAGIDGVFVALGGRYAAGELFGRIHVGGYAAWLLKKLITKSYYFGLRLRINTGFRKRTAP